jgi:dienelactone hydrolase
VRAINTSLISVLAIGLLAGSTAGVAAQDVVEPSSASAGCDGPFVEPGVYDGVNEFTSDIGDVAQAYRVVIPQGYADLAPAPLILWLANLSGFLDPAFEMWSDYLDSAESIFVTAELTDRTHLAPATLVALIDHLAAEYCVDPLRVHAMGQSSSASKVAALACAAADRIASFYGGMGSFSPKCDSPLPVPLVSLTGDADRELVSRSVEAWAENNGCDPEPVDEDLGSGVTRKEYQGCEADVVLYDVQGVGHGFVRQACVDKRGDYCLANDAFDQLRELERFFAEHPLPVG